MQLRLNELSVIRTWAKSHSYVPMYKSTSIIRTLAYPNSFVRSKRVQVIEVALYIIHYVEHGYNELIGTVKKYSL